METQQRLLTRALNRAEHCLTEVYIILRFSLGPGSALSEKARSPIIFLFDPVFYLFPRLSQKMQFFSLFVFAKNKTRNNVLDRKETFLAIKKFHLSVLKIAFFQRG